MIRMHKIILCVLLMLSGCCGEPTDFRESAYKKPYIKIPAPNPDAPDVVLFYSSPSEAYVYWPVFPLKEDTQIVNNDTPPMCYLGRVIGKRKLRVTQYTRGPESDTWIAVNKQDRLCSGIHSSSISAAIWLMDYYYNGNKEYFDNHIKRLIREAENARKSSKER